MRRRATVLKSSETHRRHLSIAGPLDVKSSIYLIGLQSKPGLEVTDFN